MSRHFRALRECAACPPGVVLQAEISQDGDIDVLTGVSGNAMLARAAIDVVKQWKYKPQPYRRKERPR